MQLFKQFAIGLVLLLGCQQRHPFSASTTTTLPTEAVQEEGNSDAAALTHDAPKALDTPHQGATSTAITIPLTTTWQERWEVANDPDPNNPVWQLPILLSTCSYKRFYKLLRRENLLRPKKNPTPYLAWCARNSQGQTPLLAMVEAFASQFAIQRDHEAMGPTRIACQLKLFKLVERQLVRHARQIQQPIVQGPLIEAVAAQVGIELNRDVTEVILKYLPHTQDHFTAQDLAGHTALDYLAHLPQQQIFSLSNWLRRQQVAPCQAYALAAFPATTVAAYQGQLGEALFAGDMRRVQQLLGTDKVFLGAHREGEVPPNGGVGLFTRIAIEGADHPNAVMLRSKEGVVLKKVDSLWL